MTAIARPRFERAARILAWAAAPVVLGVVGVKLGQDINWDLRNYHYYNGYAWLEGRLDFDIAPAQRQTYHNPLLDVPFFLAAQTWPPMLVGFLLAWLQGLNFPLLFELSRKTLPNRVPMRGSITPLAVAGLGCIGPGFIMELGTTFHDNVVSLQVILSLWLLATAFNDSIRVKLDAVRAVRIVVAGVVLGAAVGVKPTAMIFALGAAAALLMAIPTFKGKLLVLSLFGAGGAGGAALTGGFWMWTLWEHFGNPVFPYMNHIFRSPAANPASFADERFLTATWLEAVIRPWAMYWDSKLVGELQFRAPHLGVAFTSMGGLLLWLSYRRVIVREPVKVERITLFLSLFLVFTWAIWLIRFSIYRYIVALELLAPLITALLLVVMVRRRGFFMATGTLVALLLVVGSHYNFYSRVEWKSDAPYFDVDAGAAQKQPDALIVMIGGSPSAFVAPSFDARARFVRVEGNLYYYHAPGPGALYRRAAEVIENHQGPIFVVYSDVDVTHYNIVVAHVAQRFGLTVNEGACERLQQHWPSDLSFCPATRTSSDTNLPGGL